MYHLQFIGITFRKDFTRRRTSMFLTQHNRQTQQSDDLLKYSQLHRDDILSTLQSTDDGISLVVNNSLHGMSNFLHLFIIRLYMFSSSLASFLISRMILRQP